MKKRFLSLLLAAISVLSLTACNSGVPSESSDVGTSQALSVEPSQPAPSSSETVDSEESYVFTRAAERTIPEGYVKTEWVDENGTPVEIATEYAMVKNPNTNMIGLADYSGNIVVEAKYSELNFLNSVDGTPYFEAEYEGKVGVINGTGETTIPFGVFFPFDDSFMLDSSHFLGTTLLQCVAGEGFVTCITYDITKGEIGRFDIPYERIEASSSTQGATVISGAYIVATLTKLGPNGWIFPVTQMDGRICSLGIKNYQGDTLAEEEIYFDYIGLGDGRTQDATSDGYSYQPVIYIDEYGNEKYKYYIFNSSGTIVAGPYNYVTRYDDVFMCRLDAQGLDTVIYDPVADQEYSADELGNSRIAAVFERNTVLYGNSDGIFTLNLPTGVVTQICTDQPEEYGEPDTYYGGYERYISVYGETFVYMSNDTYKVCDLNGTNVGDERYYGFQDTGFGVLLKQENGDWVYLTEEGKLAEQAELFHGEGDTASTYNGFPIVGFWSYDGIPCVVVEDNGQQVGYAL